MSKIINKSKRVKNRTVNGLSPIYMSILSIMICAVCLTGTTWAWFTAENSVEVASIQSAEVELTNVTVSKVTTEQASTPTPEPEGNVAEVPGEADDQEIEGSDPTEPSAQNDPVETTTTQVAVTQNSDGSFSFIADGEGIYKVEAALGGNAKNQFIIVTIDGQQFYTTAAPFNLKLTQNANVTIGASWIQPEGAAQL